MWRKRFLKAMAAVVALGALAEMGLRLSMGLGNPVLSTRDAACAYMMAPNQDVTRFGVRNYINRYSMRSHDFSEAKPADTFRILCLGDSITYGTTHVDQAKIFTGRLEQTLAEQHKHVEVLNASAGGWGPGNELGYLKSRGTFHADLVVFCVNPTDLDGDTNPGLLGLEYGQPEHKPVLALQELWVRYAMPRLANLLEPAQAHAAGPSITDNLATGVPVMLREMQQAKGFANRNGAAFAVIYTSAKTGDAGFDTAATHAAHDRLVAWTRENSVPIVDVSAAFAACNQNELYIDNLHIQEMGHEIIAEAFREQWPVLASTDLIHTQRDGMLAIR
jgi:lysophospholipase L1-like esterase